MKAEKSHYKFFQQLSFLRRDDVFTKGNFSSKDISSNIFAYSRSYDDKTFVVFINLGQRKEGFTINELGDFGDNYEVVLASSISNFNVG